MHKFSIEELYKRVAKIDVLRNDTKSVIRHGAGFFYRYKENIFFATKREHIIIEEKAFLPDSLVLHPDIEAKTSGVNGITLQLYDENEKPTWRLLPTQTEDQYVSIPVQSVTTEKSFVQYFVSKVQLPTYVLLPLDETTLKIPVSTCVSLANYFFYSQEDDERLRKEIENEQRFRIYRKGFALDMLEMVLLLMEKNISVMKSLETKSFPQELLDCLRTHQKLVDELEKIISQFSDVLEPSVSERIQNLFNIVKKENFLQDYPVVHYLINRILSQFGNNIIYLQ
jgi:hypothetical protein